MNIGVEFMGSADSEAWDEYVYTTIYHLHNASIL